MNLSIIASIFIASMSICGNQSFDLRIENVKPLDPLYMTPMEYRKIRVRFKNFEKKEQYV